MREPCRVILVLSPSILSSNTFFFILHCPFSPSLGVDGMQGGGISKLSPASSVFSGDVFSIITSAILDVLLWTLCKAHVTYPAKKNWAQDRARGRSASVASKIYLPRALPPWAEHLVPRALPPWAEHLVPRALPPWAEHLVPRALPPWAEHLVPRALPPWAEHLVPRALPPWAEHLVPRAQ